MSIARRRIVRWLTMGFGACFALIPQGWQRVFAQGKAEKIGTIAELEKAGFLSGKLADKTPVLVFRDPKDKTKLVAFDATCSHAGCASDFKDGTIICPCHGSRFALDGSVSRGPARQPLKSLTVKVEGEAVLVSV